MQRLTKAQRHANEAARRRRAAARRTLAEYGATGGRTIRLAYQAKSGEVTVRQLAARSIELRVSKTGSRYLRAFDHLRGADRSFSVANIGWATAA